MKKYVKILLCLVLAALCIVPTCAFAEPVDDTDDIIYFLNPKAIAVTADKLFVADNIENGKSVIVTFDSGDKPVYRSTTELEGNIVNMSAKENGLYVVLEDRVEEYAIVDNKLNSVGVNQVVGVLNFTEGASGTGTAQYYATAERISRIDGDETYDVSIGGIENVADINFVNDFLYVLSGSEQMKLLRWDGTKYGAPQNDVVNSKLDISESGARGLLTWMVNGEKVPAYFSKNAITYVDIATASATPALIMSYDGEVYDAVADDHNLYILNGAHEVTVYANDNLSRTAVIGTDTLPRAVPQISEFTDYTLVKSVGYPANIVFKTSDVATSVPELIENADEYIVLGFDNERNFYYVLVGDKFGWVKKSDGATSPEDDAKLQVIDTAVGGEHLEYRTQFVSLNSVWVYPLPREAFKPTTPFTQSATDRADVVPLQRFTEQTENSETEWYYVRYDGDKLGFVKRENIGNFHIKADVDAFPDVKGDRKANGPLFGFVQLYDNNNPETMNSEHYACDEEGNVLHLGSGTRVTLIKEFDNGTASVQVAYGDGSTAFGYCYLSNLIGTGSLTTNAIFGLVAVTFAVALAVTLTVVFIKRRKSKAAKKEDSPHAE